MVLEHIISGKIIEKKRIYAFYLGLIYSVVGIGLASLLFPADPSLVAVAFTAILLLPSIRILYRIEERQIKKDKKFSFKALWKDENDFISVYLLMILGVFIVYSLFALFLPSFQVNGLFRDQLELRGAGAVDNIAGHAFSTGLFTDLLTNNILVLIACVIMAFLTGDGAIFLLTWNASLWGTIFGVTARNASFVSHMNPFLLLLLIFCIVLPHAFIEILSYILGSISGGLMSSDIELDPGESRKQQFRKSYWKMAFLIFCLAILFVLIGAFVETFVLDNVTIYSRIIEQSYML